MKDLVEGLPEPSQEARLGIAVDREIPFHSGHYVLRPVGTSATARSDEEHTYRIQGHEHGKGDLFLLFRIDESARGALVPLGHNTLQFGLECAK